MFPNKFVFYIDHQELQYLNSQFKLNQRHMKWVEFLQSSTFVLNHKLGKSKRVIDALSRRSTLLSTMTMEVVGLEDMNKL
jgi:hypothetical protein